ncbi:hypothetical protein ACM26W_01275 [Halomonas sp. HK25]|uniref:hypothetical protein n=1 Tax=Halomonas sp. HK25 TaxID=3394321 RepID=UPI0039FD313A
MELKTYFAQDQEGKILPEAFVYVYEPGTTTLASGLVDKAGATLENPFQTDSNGLIQLAAPDGAYDLRVAKTGLDYTLRVQFLDAREAVDSIAASADRAESEADRAEQAVIDGTATAQQLATAQADRSESEANRAESARDAAQLSAGVYADTATGLAATSDGDYFSVPSSETNEFLILYRNNAGAAVEVNKYPSSRLVSALNYGHFGGGVFATNGFVDDKGEVPGSSIYWFYTDYLKVEGATSYVVAAAANANAYHAWYDENKVFISAFRVGETTSLEIATFTSPPAARFVRLSTRDTQVDNSSIVAADGNYDIEKLLKVLAEHNPAIRAESVAYASGTVATQLGAILEKQSAILSGQNRLVSQLDLMTDKDASFFVNSWAFTKAINTPSDVSPVTIVSRDDDSTFTVATGEGTRLHPTGSVVIRDDAADEHLSYAIMGIDGDTISVAGTLPASISVAQTMHEAPQGQHLSSLGYKGLADHLASRVQKYAYKKDSLLFAYHPPVCSKDDFSNPNILNYDASELLIPVTRIGGAGAGGFVAGTTDLVRLCATDTSDVNATANTSGRYLSRGYTMRQSAAGAGIEMRFAVNQADGFLEAPIAALSETYTSDAGTAETTTGRVRLEVLGDEGQVFHDATYSPELMHYEYIEFSGADELIIRVTLADDTPSSINLGGLYAYRKSADTSKDAFFKNGDVVAFLGDSWTQFPLQEEGETKPLRPDGTTAEGMQYLPERLRENLSNNGIGITTLNYGRGGQTSAWGLYWVDAVISASPRPTHCVVLFGINDNNSIDEYESGGGYYFDPDDMWGGKPPEEGGISGATNTDIWFSNLQAICERLSTSGIKPIVMMPAHTASASQAQSIQQRQLNKIAAGFSDINAPREG